MVFSRYAASDLASFLIAIDAELEQPATLVVIGGCALALGYGGTAATNDIDTTRVTFNPSKRQPNGLAHKPA